MNRFSFSRAATIAEAVDGGAGAATRYLAGGTNLVDLMKENVERPEHLVDLSLLPLKKIDDLDGGGLRLGALATNTETAMDDRVAARYPVVRSAILAGASPQLRNAATNGGNLNQRTRCYYFYDTATPCNKRLPGSGCSAIAGVSRIHAILGTSDHCIATHPSDLCVALAVLDAEVQVTGPRGERTIPFLDYHRLPGDHPELDNTLEPGELVTSIDLPAEGFSSHHTYLKLRDRLSYAFALVSVAAVMHMEEDRVVDAHVALGGVAHKPWRRPDAEAILKGRAPTETTYRDFAEALLDGARGTDDNDFKIALAKKAVVRALRQAAAATPQSQVDKRVA